MAQKVKILMTEFVTHNVRRFILEKPKDLSWTPGQGTDVALGTPKTKDDWHPFTPTSLPDDGVLEYTIKGYPKRQGLTNELHRLAPGAELLIGDSFGDIRYKGRGVFIAGGAGITPFLAILRQLSRQGGLEGNSLIFSNKTWADIIQERELRSYLGDRCIFTLTQEPRAGYENRKVDVEFLKAHIDDFGQFFYVCGPKRFLLGTNEALRTLGAKAEQLVFDEP